MSPYLQWSVFGLDLSACLHTGSTSTYIIVVAETLLYNNHIMLSRKLAVRQVFLESENKSHVKFSE